MESKVVCSVQMSIKHLVCRSHTVMPVLLLLCRAENPCPEQGDIIQIKLSEHTEVLPKADGTGSTTMLVDTVFEMNYSTGQWTRLKKYKPITNTSWDSPPCCSLPLTQRPAHPAQPHVCTNTSICIHIRAKNGARSRWEVIKERKSSLFFCTSETQDSSLNISLLSVWFLYCFVLCLFVDTSPLIPDWHCGSVGKVLVLWGSLFSVEEQVMCRKLEETTFIFFCTTDVHGSLCHSSMDSRIVWGGQASSSLRGQTWVVNSETSICFIIFSSFFIRREEK